MLFCQEPQIPGSFLKAPFMPFTLCDSPWSQLTHKALAELGKTFGVFNNWFSSGAHQPEWLPAHKQPGRQPYCGASYLGESWQAARALVFSGSI